MTKTTKKIIYCTVTNDLNQDQRMHRIATSLSDNGYEVHVVGSSKIASEPLLQMNFGQHRINCWFRRGFLFYMEYNIRLFLYLLVRKMDIVYSVDLDTIMVGVLHKIMKGSKLVYDAHEYFTETPEVVHRPVIKAVWSSIARLCVPRADRAISVSQSLCDVLSDVYGLPFTCLYNVPFRTTEGKEFPTKDKKYILYQGMLNRGRGLREMIEAMEYIDPDYELWLVGIGDIGAELKAISSQSTATDRIHFLGWKSPPELNKITQHATLGLNLLEADGLSYYYSLANKFFDYMHAGVPSINRSFPAYEAIISRYEVGLLLDDLSKTTIADQINGLLNDVEKYTKIQTQCAEANRVFNWQNEEKKLLSLISF